MDGEICRVQDNKTGRVCCALEVRDEWGCARVYADEMETKSTMPKRRCNLYHEKEELFVVIVPCSDCSWENRGSVVGLLVHARARWSYDCKMSTVSL